jgi:hypothetical protein
MKTKTINQNGPAAKTIDSGRIWRYKLGSAVALLTGVLLLMAMISFIVSPQPEKSLGWITRFQDLWLIVIFKLHAGISPVQPDPLVGLNLLDLVMMLLVGITGLSLYPTLKRSSKIWSLVAMSLPFAGIAVLVATKLAGRSSVMGQGL